MVLAILAINSEAIAAKKEYAANIIPTQSPAVPLALAICSGIAPTDSK